MVSEPENDPALAARTEHGDDAMAGDGLAVGILHTTGEVIAHRYRLTALLGQGGMGDVWRAHDETLDIEVALKLIRPQEDGEDSEDRLLREARIAARLGHPGIVRIFDFGRSELDEPFIVMELLEGTDLGATMRARGAMNPAKAVGLILPIVHALGAAHAKGIVHRDLKPDNIFLAKLDGDQCQPKIVDFGIAKLDRAKAMRLTRTGALIGSPTYMSPEQGRGDEVDHRTDLWSLCVVLYEMIAGRPPFQARNAHALLHAIRVGEAEPIPLATPADEELWAILARGLEKDVTGRWPHARELGAALAKWLQTQGVTEDVTGASLEATWSGRGATFDSIAPLAELRVEGRNSNAPTVIDPQAPPRRRRVIAAAVLAVLTTAAAGFALGAVLRDAPMPDRVESVPAPDRVGGPAVLAAAPPDEPTVTTILEPPPPSASEGVAESVPEPPPAATAARPIRPRPKVKAAPRPSAPRTTTTARPKMKDPFQ
jgi:eukaryotic-like serine/threonine-protein kinase